MGELRELENHVTKCSKDIISCPYSGVGCTASVLKKNLEDHKTVSAVEHIALAMERIIQLEGRFNMKAEINVPPVVFKMDNIPDNADYKWDSPPFYTHDKGYKLYLKVSMRRSGHISVLVMANMMKI